MANEQSESGLNYAIGIDATILLTQVAGLLKGGTEGTEVLILPRNVETRKTLSFEVLLKEISKQFHIEEKTIRDTMNGIKAILPRFDPEKLTFQLNQIFFYYKKGKEAANATTEYAFSIKINLGEILNLAGVISIETLYMAIWDTTRQSVLNQFNMVDISALLPD